jgi:hypothetical protein
VKIGVVDAHSEVDRERLSAEVRKGRCNSAMPLAIDALWSGNLLHFF